MLSIFWETSERMFQVDFLHVERYTWGLRSKAPASKANLEEDLPRLWLIEDSIWLSAWATRDQVDPWIPVCANLKHLRFSCARWQLECLACEYEIPANNPSDQP